MHPLHRLPSGSGEGTVANACLAGAGMSVNTGLRDRARRVWGSFLCCRPPRQATRGVICGLIPHGTCRFGTQRCHGGSRHAGRAWPRSAANRREFRLCLAGDWQGLAGRFSGRDQSWPGLLSAVRNFGRGWV